MSVTVAALAYPVKKYVECTVAFDSSYPTGGEAITAKQFGLASFSRIVVQPTSGYICQPVIAAGGLTAVLKMYDVAAVTPAGTNSAVGGLDYATPVFSGTGQTSSGQDITTTDNQTMTLDQCKGMWFVSATHGPYLIAGNTAVNGAPAVLTIYGTAPTTDAGTYKILKNAAQTFAGTLQAAAGLAEVPSLTNLSALSAVVVQVWGY